MSERPDYSLGPSCLPDETPDDAYPVELCPWHYKPAATCRKCLWPERQPCCDTCGNHPEYDCEQELDIPVYTAVGGKYYCEKCLAGE